MADLIIYKNINDATVNNSLIHFSKKEFKKINCGRQQSQSPNAPMGARAIKQKAKRRVAKSIVKYDFELAKMIAKIVSETNNDFRKSKVETHDKNKNKNTTMGCLLRQSETRTRNASEPISPPAPAPAPEPPPAAVEPTAAVKKIKRVAPEDFEKVLAEKKLAFLANSDTDDKTIEEGEESGTRALDASIGGIVKQRDKSFVNDFLASIKNIKKDTEISIKDDTKNDVKNDTKNNTIVDTNDTENEQKNKCFFTFDLPDIYNMRHVSSEIGTCIETTKEAFDRQKNYLLKNNSKYDTIQFDTHYRYFTQDEIDLLNFNHNFSLKKCRNILFKLYKLKYLVDNNHMFINLRKQENYYNEGNDKKEVIIKSTVDNEKARLTVIGDRDKLEQSNTAGLYTPEGEELSNCIELNAYERSLLMHRAIMSVYMTKSEFNDKYKIFIPPQLLENEIIQKILNLKYYNSYIKQLLCIVYTSFVFRRVGHFSYQSIAHETKRFFKDFGLLESGCIDNYFLIGRCICFLFNAKKLNVFNLQNTVVLDSLNENCLYQGFLDFNMMQVIGKTHKLNKVYAKKIIKQFEKNDVNEGILKQCEAYLK